MPDRTNATATTAGILRPEEFARRVRLERRPAGPDVTRWVENHWLLTWDLPAAARVPSQVLAHPTRNLTVERGSPRAGVGTERVLVSGVATGRFDVTLWGRGWVWGVRFRPGGLAALAGRDASTLTDRTVPAATVVPSGELEVRLAGVDEAIPATEAAARVEEALLGLADGRTDERADAAYDEVLGVVAAMLADRSWVRVDQVEEGCGISRRRLQRLFARYVGVGPKWVLARYRLHDAVTALDQGYDGTLADLAATYGWYDQAHFAREFGLVVGVPPGEYRARSCGSAY